MFIFLISVFIVKLSSHFLAALILHYLSANSFFQFQDYEIVFKRPFEASNQIHHTGQVGDTVRCSMLANSFKITRVTQLTETSSDFNL